MKLTWKRPDNVPYPSVWKTFEGRTHADQTPYHYKIQDLTEEYFEAAIEFMCRYFIIRENTCYSTGFAEDKTSEREISDMWRTALEQKMSLICLATDPDTGSEKIAAVNVLLISSKDDRKPKFQGHNMCNVWILLEDLQADYDVFEKCKIGAYMAAFGLCVSPQFSGDNVGYEVLMARTPLGLSVGVLATVTAFTGKASQHIARKAGFYEVSELKYQEYKQKGKVAYPRLDGSCILMVKELKNTH